MKFVSKSSNLLIVLRPGLSAQPLTGTPAKPTISVRFKDGMADVQQQELIDMMLAHPGFNSDFISAEINPGEIADPYANSRLPSEPAHVLTEMKFGTPVARSTKGPLPQLSPEIQKLVESMAANMAKAMLPGMVESTIKELVSNHATDTPSPAKATAKAKGKAPAKKTAGKTKAKEVEIPDEIVADSETEPTVG